MSVALKSLPDDPALLKEMVNSYRSELHHKDLLIEKLKSQLFGMKRSRFGASSESLDQIELQLEDREVAQAGVSALSEEEQPVKDKPRRRPLPDHLPREDQTLEPEECCAHCGGRLKRLGEDVTEELEYVPGRFHQFHFYLLMLEAATIAALSEAACAWEVMNCTLGRNVWRSVLATLENS